MYLTRFAIIGALGGRKEESRDPSRREKDSVRLFLEKLDLHPGLLPYIHCLLLVFLKLAVRTQNVLPGPFWR